MIDQKKSFFRARLKNASLSELVFRTVQLLDTFRMRFVVRWKSELDPRYPSLPSDDLDRLVLPELRGDISSEMLHCVMRGGLFTLSADRESLKSAEEKAKDCFLPRTVPSDQGFDIRQAWEPARLQNVMMLIARILDGCDHVEKEDCARFALEAACRWVEDHPFPYGIHYVSAMECGLRIPVFTYGSKHLTGRGSKEREMLLHAIYRHAWWVSRRLSLYSSLGNHTVAECVGLVFAGAIFRQTMEGKRWISKATGLLEEEVDHQILQDGGPAEQSINYHRFVLDLYWLAVNFLEDNGLHDCSRIKERLAIGEEFYETLLDEKGYPPSIGDSDDGCAVAPGIHPVHPKATIEKKRYRCFKESGYSVFRLSNNVMTFDHGPLGMAPLYNHGHADALSITLSKGGEPLLVDPGTYRYNGIPEWRKYFKGTRAHNTVTVDGVDQAVQETGFIWSHPFQCDVERIEETEAHIEVVAKHDGYKRLKGPVLHRRKLVCFKDSVVVIRDSFEGDGVHTFELNYHLHPAITPEFRDGWWRIENQGNAIFLKLADNGSFRQVRGQENPIKGWYSPRYGVKRESIVLGCEKEGVPHEVSFLTVICTSDMVDEKNVEEAIRCA